MRNRSFLPLVALFVALTMTGCSQAEPEAEMTPAQQAMQRGLEFLEQNGKREGVTTTASGLQYEVITEGTGARPTADQTVTVHYEGTFLDGRVFDSSYQRGETISFPLRGVIAGWTEGLQYMSIGSKYKLYIPSQLGYGPQGVGPIGPNETLIFTVELLGIS